MAAAIGYYPRFRSYVPATGLPNVGGTVQFFAAGSATPLPVYSDATLTVPLANPLTLDANGEALFYTGAGVAYKLTVKDASAALIWTEDNIIFGGGSGTSVVGSSGEWTQFSGTPTFINATQFSVVGDQTATFDAKRRLKSTVTAGTAYSTVVSSLFSAGNTTITVLNDALSSLDAGLSVVQIGILDPVHPSIPNISSFVRKNFLVNGAMLISQRIGGIGNSVTIAATQGYTLDRWQGKSGAGSSAIFQQISTVGLIDGLPNAIRMQRTAANAAVTLIQLAQSLETGDATPLADQFVTLSFWGRSGSNYSPNGGLLNAAVTYGTGVDQNVLAGYTGAASPINVNVALTGLWQRFQAVALIPAGATEVGAVFSMTPVGVAGANDYCEITGVQLEVSYAATDFDYRPLGEVLARCQRYYEKSFNQNVVPAQGAAVSGAFTLPASKAGALGQTSSYVGYLVAKRVLNGALVFYNPAAANAQVRDSTAAADCSATALGNSSERGFYFTFTGNAGTAVGNALQVQWTNDAEL